MQVLNESTFVQEVVSKPLMLIQFGSEFCPACIRMKGILEGLEQRIKQNRIIFAQVDIDDNPTLEEQFEIECAPTLIVVKEGVIVGRHEGQMSDKETRKFVMKSIASNQNRHP